MSTFYRVSDEQLATYASSSIAARIAWLDDIRTTTWALATPEVRAEWARARSRVPHPLPEPAELRGEAKARIWRGDAVAFAYPVCSVREVALDAKVALDPNVALDPKVAARSREPTAFCLEFARHLGPRFTGALLGATFTPSASGATRIRVHEASDDGPVWPLALLGAPPPDRLHLGLPAYAADALLADASSAAALGPGTIEVNRAAHFEIASSPSSFALAFRAVVACLSADPVDIKRILSEML